MDSRVCGSGGSNRPMFALRGCLRDACITSVRADPSAGSGSVLLHAAAVDGGYALAGGRGLARDVLPAKGPQARSSVSLARVQTFVREPLTLFPWKTSR